MSLFSLKSGPFYRKVQKVFRSNVTTLPSSFQSFEFALHYRDSATSGHRRKYEVVVIVVGVIIVVVAVIIVIIVAVVAVVVFVAIVFVVVVLIVVVVVDGAIAIIMSSSSFPCYLVEFPYFFISVNFALINLFLSQKTFLYGNETNLISRIVLPH